MASTVRTSAAAALAAALAAGVVLSLGHVSTAGATTDTTATAGTTATATQHLVFFIQDKTQSAIDLAPAGESQGDLFTYHGLAYNHKGGKVIGRFGGTCTTLAKSMGLPADSSCFLDASLPGGQLYVEGFGESARLFGGKKWAFGVIGGTGLYRGARGAGTIVVPTNVKDATDGYVDVDVIL